MTKISDSISWKAIFIVLMLCIGCLFIGYGIANRGEMKTAVDYLVDFQKNNECTFQKKAFPMSDLNLSVLE